MQSYYTVCDEVMCDGIHNIGVTLCMLVFSADQTSPQLMHESFIVLLVGPTASKYTIST